jgi:hypothetical protein
VASVHSHFAAVAKSESRACVPQRFAGGCVVCAGDQMRAACAPRPSCAAVAALACRRRAERPFALVPWRSCRALRRGQLVWTQPAGRIVGTQKRETLHYHRASGLLAMGMVPAGRVFVTPQQVRVCKGVRRRRPFPRGCCCWPCARVCSRVRGAGDAPSAPPTAAVCHAHTRAHAQAVIWMQKRSMVAVFTWRHPCDQDSFSDDD